MCSEKISESKNQYALCILKNQSQRDFESTFYGKEKEMTIGNVSGMAVQGTGRGLQQGMNAQTDAVSKNIQKQIMDAQKQLQELSSNNDMNMEERMKKRQEIQQQISDLNMQLRQHQIEQRKEQQAKKAAKEEQTRGNTQAESGKQKTGLSKASMHAMISAESSMKQAQVQGSVATSMEGRAGVLKAEIKQDGATGGDTKSKEEELAQVEQKAEQATASQMESLGKANKTIEEAAERQGQTESAEKSSEEPKEKKTVQTNQTKDDDKMQHQEDAAATKQEVQSSVKKDAEPSDDKYPSIDIRL